MHTMSVQDKLRLHLADKTVTWRQDVPDALAAAQWRDDATRLVLAFSGPVTASTVIDAYNAGRGAKVTLLHEGPVGDVARRSAGRFGITLLDAATLPDAPPVAPPRHLAEALAPGHAATFDAPRDWSRDLLPAPVPELLLPAHVEPMALPLAEAPAPPAAEPGPAIVPALPWDASVPPSDPFSTMQVSLEVTPHEILAMPWTLHPDSPVEDHVEITSTRRGPRGSTVRPTTDLHPDAKHWGLPWPRPVTPADGLAIADPKIWNNPARLESLHASFDARASKLSAPTPPGTPDPNWLKKLQFDGVK